MSPEKCRDDAARFWSKVERSNGCWRFTAADDGHGYGAFNFHGRMQKAQRVAWELTHGPIATGVGAQVVCVLHRCDNRRCVRPDHLFLGTRGDNARDMSAKGRGPPGKAKLSSSDVTVIRAALAGGASVASIARLYGVHRWSISKIGAGRTWKTPKENTYAIGQ